MTFYAFIVFLSAFLLFQIQPMIAKYILPWFGGTPAVWSTSLLFFQALLTGGYAYAYWLIGKVEKRRQGQVHLALLTAALALLLVTALMWTSPITPGASWKPQDVDFPVIDIFKILAVSVGLPYFLLATNSPLMQAWFSRDYAGKSPYRLYALSNVGSLLALVTYPVLVEPTFALTSQGWIWSIGFAAFALFAAYGAIKTMRAARVADALPTVTASGIDDPPPDAATRALWIVLPACASVLLLAITSQMTQEVAVIPFLWVLPLTIYLLSFILTFDSDRWYSRRVFTYALFLIGAAFTIVLAHGPGLELFVQIGVYSLLLFVCCMICHGELVRLKPHPNHLTSFYLLISIGGAVGGIFVGLIAPYIFKGYWELPLGLLLCAVLLFVMVVSHRQNVNPYVVKINLTLAAGAIILFGAVLFMYVKTTMVDPLFATRNFYGVLRVDEVNANTPELRAYRLAHGAVTHGFQYIASDKRDLPTAYYTEQSGIGLAFLNDSKRPGPMRIGILGLGIGIMAAYTKPGDMLRFYEINPDVIRLAEGEGGYFSYLKDAAARVQIVPGDARISLEQELAASQPQHFDLLVLDTFNSDSIPVHLLTREAFEIYLQHLQPDGILALHISNNYLDLRPVVYKLADEFHLGATLIQTPAEGDRVFLSDWMLVTRDQAFLDQPAIASRASPRTVDTNRFRLWTDDYSNLFQVLR
jgi:hypothetical protein